MSPGSTPRSPIRRALTTRAVWARSAKLGLVVGIIQVSLNQGDHWLHHEVTRGVVIKTILSPLLSFGIAFASAASTHAELLSRSASTSSP